MKSNNISHYQAQGQSNQQLVKETKDIQNQTKNVIQRIHKQVDETEALGNATLEELREQGRQMNDINEVVTHMNLDKSEALLNRFDFWSGNFFKGGKKQVVRKGLEEVVNKYESTLSKEVFENQKYDGITRQWKSSSITLCSNPSKEVNGLFDPACPSSKWKIDFSLAGVSADGWSYAFDFSALNTGHGYPDMKWNSYVRRRKWKYVELPVDKKLAEVKQRQIERNSSKQHHNNPSNQQKTEYVARRSSKEYDISYHSNYESLDDLTKVELVDIARTDAEVDSELGILGVKLDRINFIAKNINQEVKTQRNTIEEMDENVSGASNKVAVLVCRQRKYI